MQRFGQGYRCSTASLVRKYFVSHQLRLSLSCFHTLDVAGDLISARTLHAGCFQRSATNFLWAAVKCTSSFSGRARSRSFRAIWTIYDLGGAA